MSPVIAQCHSKSIRHQKHTFRDVISFSNPDSRGWIIAEYLSTRDPFPAGVLRPPCFLATYNPFSLSIAILIRGRYSAAHESFDSFSRRMGVRSYLTGRSERVVVGGESPCLYLGYRTARQGVHGSADGFEIHPCYHMDGMGRSICLQRGQGVGWGYDTGSQWKALALRHGYAIENLTTLMHLLRVWIGRFAVLCVQVDEDASILDIVAALRSVRRELLGRLELTVRTHGSHAWDSSKVLELLALLGFLIILLRTPYVFSALQTSQRPPCNSHPQHLLHPENSHKTLLRQAQHNKFITICI